MGFPFLDISLHPAVWVFHLWGPSTDADKEIEESLRTEVPSWKKDRTEAPI